MSPRNLFAIVVLFVCAAQLHAWHGELLTISKGVKTYTMVIRNYDPEEWPTINSRINEEGFDRLSCFQNPRDGRIKIGPRSFDALKLGRNVEPMSAGEFYDFLQTHLGGELPTVISSSCHYGACHKGIYNHYTDIFINQPDNDQDRKLSMEMFNNAKIAMQRIAGEDAATLYRELHFDRQAVARKIVVQEEKPGFWQQLTDYVQNKKFIVAVAAGCAAYFGYKYIKKKNILFQNI